MKLLTRSLTALLFILVTALLIAVAAPRDAYALSCAPTTPQMLVDRSDIIFTGTVRSISGAEQFKDTTAVIDVERFLKGSGPSRLTLDWKEAGWFGSWKAENVGQRYLIFTKLEGANYVAALCNGTRPLVANDQDGYLASIQAVTGPGLPPDASLPLPPTESASNTALWVIGGAATLLVAAIAATFTFHRRSAMLS